MSHSFLEQLLHSDVFTDRCTLPDSEEYRQESKLQAEYLKKLEDCLGAENWHLLEQYTSHRNAASDMENDEEILVGFRCGALCMLEILDWYHPFSAMTSTATGGTR